MYSTIVDAETVERHATDPGWRIVDCRFSLADTEQGRRAYHASHLPGAVYAHLDEDLSAPVVAGRTGRHPLPAVETLAKLFSAWGIDGDVQVVAYDDNAGYIASRLWWILNWLGHDRVAVMDGGWDRWRQEGRAEATSTPEIAPRRFTPRCRCELLVDAAHVESISGDASWRLLDARAEARFRGEAEPIDPVAGHIPGALCAPCQDNVGPDGLMKAPEALCASGFALSSERRRQAKWSATAARASRPATISSLFVTRVSTAPSYTPDPGANGSPIRCGLLARAIRRRWQHRRRRIEERRHDEKIGPLL